MCILYMADPVTVHEWRQALASAVPDLEFRQWPDVGDTSDIKYIIAWDASPDLAEKFPNLKVLYSAGAGVDQFDLSQLPERVSLVRLVDESMADIMAEYVVFAVLALHRDILSYKCSQREKVWKSLPIIPACRRRVGVMGLGNLGRVALDRLLPFGFQLSGWNRSSKFVPGGRCFVGLSQLPGFLAQCDILVNLLPLTSQTEGIINVETLGYLPVGAGIVNVGRGKHVVEEDLLAALESGRLGGVVLDVMREEPPSQHHPFWSNPRVIMTPHVASNVQIEGSVEIIRANLDRELNGLPLINEVCRARGY